MLSRTHVQSMKSAKFKHALLMGPIYQKHSVAGNFYRILASSCFFVVRIIITYVPTMSDGGVMMN